MNKDCKDRTRADILDTYRNDGKAGPLLVSFAANAMLAFVVFVLWRGQQASGPGLALILLVGEVGIALPVFFALAWHPVPSQELGGGSYQPGMSERRMHTATAWYHLWRGSEALYLSGALIALTTVFISMLGWSELCTVCVLVLWLVASSWAALRRWSIARQAAAVASGSKPGNRHASIGTLAFTIAMGGFAAIIRILSRLGMVTLQGMLVIGVLLFSGIALLLLRPSTASYLSASLHFQAARD